MCSSHHELTVWMLSTQPNADPSMIGTSGPPSISILALSTPHISKADRRCSTDCTLDIPQHKNVRWRTALCDCSQNWRCRSLQNAILLQCSEVLLRTLHIVQGSPQIYLVVRPWHNLGIGSRTCNGYRLGCTRPRTSAARSAVATRPSGAHCHLFWLCLFIHFVQLKLLRKFIADPIGKSTLEPFIFLSTKVLEEQLYL